MTPLLPRQTKRQFMPTRPSPAQLAMLTLCLMGLIAPANAQNASTKQALPGKRQQSASLFRPSAASASLSPDMASGLEYLKTRQFSEASAAFKRQLNKSPHDEEALLALASIAEIQGQHAVADSWRQRAYQAAPLSPQVQAAILGTPGNIQQAPISTESRLKTQLARYPDAARLHFALGNLKLAQGDWPEAQAAFLAALANDRDNPDYLFNLAISLEQQREQRRAATYYQAALQAAEFRPTAFDPQIATRRLRELTGEAKP